MNVFTDESDDWHTEPDVLQARVDACRKRLEYARATREARWAISASAWLWLAFLAGCVIVGYLR